MKYQKHNNNPLKNKTTDCVIRSISFGLGVSWIKVFDDLNLIARQLLLQQSDNKVLIEYLKDYEHNTLKAIKGQPRKKVKDFDKGTYILSIANHLTIVKDGCLFDTWDCRNKTVYRYWKINEVKK